MEIKIAGLSDQGVILDIVHRTIKSIYPNYYPTEVVDFFLEYHNALNIRNDLEKGNIYLIAVDKEFIATGTIDGRSIGRLYVLPEYQGKGYGRILMNVMENRIKDSYNSAILEASLPSYEFYLKAGYRPTRYLRYMVKNNRVLCYYEMEKTLID